MILYLLTAFLEKWHKYAPKIWNVAIYFVTLCRELENVLRVCVFWT